jgi:peroxidase
MSIYGLDLGDGYYDAYDEECSPDVLNEFATAAFRFGHSLIRDHIKVRGHDFRRGKALFALFTNHTEDALPLRHHINKPDLVLSSHFVDELMEGLAHEPMATYGEHLSVSLSECHDPHPGATSPSRRDSVYNW